MPTLDDDSLLPAINSKLHALAGPEHLWPEWYRQWLKLGPESTDAERVAVCQSIWDSGELPEDVGFSLVVWQINEIADRLAETRLKNLIDQMNAIEDAFEQKHGRDWAESEEPAEFTELLQEYDKARTDIFVECLNASGEGEVADYYMRGFDAFSRRYEHGLDYFKSAHGTTLISSNDFVPVASFITAPQADVACMALHEEGILTSLDNANLITWDWFYSNAVHGVRLSVPAKDEVAALRILRSLSASVSGPNQKCPHCGEICPPDWKICWKCGHSLSDDNQTTEPEETTPDPKAIEFNAAIEPLLETDNAPNSASEPALPIFEGVLLLMLLGLFMYSPLLGGIAIPILIILFLIYRWAMAFNCADSNITEAHKSICVMPEPEPAGATTAKINPYKSPVDAMNEGSDPTLSSPSNGIYPLILVTVLLFLIVALFLFPAFVIGFAYIAFWTTLLFFMYRRAKAMRSYDSEDAES